MPAYQYIYVMKDLAKTYPGGREVVKDIWLSFPPGAKMRQRRAAMGRGEGQARLTMRFR